MRTLFTSMTFSMESKAAWGDRMTQIWLWVVFSLLLGSPDKHLCQGVMA